MTVSDLLSFIDRLRERSDPVPSRPEAIRQALQTLRVMTNDLRDEPPVTPL